MPKRERTRVIARLLALAGAAVFALAATTACSGDGDTTAPASPTAAAATNSAPATAAATGAGRAESLVHPIDEIVSGEIAIVDLTPSSAALSVETSVDVACAVVYGPTTEYGAIATDLDMAGGGHRVHRAPLRGLEPDTLYHYRLQGSGPDGTLYRSEDMTFRTPPAAESGASTRGPNLAAAAAGARVVDVSSVFGNSETWAAENAIDGDLGSEWSSQGDGDDAFITIALAETAPLTAVGLWTRTMTTSAQIQRFQVVTDSGDVLGPFDVPDASSLHVFDVEATARTLRFEVVESSGGNTGIVELAAFGPPAD